jgi:segregation and condensation protein B
MRKKIMAKSLKLILEALLFSSDKPLTTKDFRDCLPEADTSDIKNALKVLEHDYEVLDRSYTLKEVAGGYQFRTRSEYGSYILKMLQSTPNRLSRASMETLAIIAYKQPILRHEIEMLRGVDVGGILKTLLEKGLIKIMGRKHLPGRPLIYGTTKRFLEVFDLQDISSLPKLKEIKDFGSEEYEPSSLHEQAASEQEPGGVFEFLESPPEKNDAGPETAEMPSHDEPDKERES